MFTLATANTDGLACLNPMDRGEKVPVDAATCGGGTPPPGTRTGPIQNIWTGARQESDIVSSPRRARANPLILIH